MPTGSVQLDTPSHAQASADSSRPTTAATVAEGEADVLNRFAEIGLTPRTGWYASIALYTVGAIPAIALPLIDPAAFSRVFLWLGLVSLLVAALSVVGLKRFPNSVRATHMRLSIGLLILTTGAIVVGDARQAFVMLTLTTLVPPAIYFGVREAAAYGVVAGVVVAACLMPLNEPWALAMALCSTTALMTISVSMMMAQARTRSMAREFNTLAYSDPLTGLANARSLHQQLGDALTASKATNQHVALFAIDLDNFKLINDDVGYSAGDALLIAVGDALTDAVDPEDLVARRGGDEYSVLIKAPQTRDLEALTRDLSLKIRDVRRQVCPTITPSASVAFVCSTDYDDVASILQRADDALHERKTAFHADDTGKDAPRVAVLDTRSESERAGGEHQTDRRSRRRDEERDRGKWAKLPRGSKAIDRPIWLVVAAMQIVIGSALVAIVLLGWIEAADRADCLIFGGASLVIAALSMIGAKVPLSRNLTHYSYSASIIVLVLAVSAVGETGAAILDLFAIPALFGFHLYKPRFGAAYLIASVMLYGYLALAGAFPFGEARVVIFALMTLSAATLFAKVRSVTSRFIVQTWELSQRDALTGAANMRALRARLADATKRANAGKVEVAIIALDLDEFKQVNDRYSHSKGDETLIAVAHAVENNTRVEDLVARRGGDEFVVLIEGAGRTEVAQLAARIGASIVHTRGRICADLVPDVSVVCVFHARGEDSDVFLRKADEALHDRKLESRRERIDAVA